MEIHKARDDGVGIKPDQLDKATATAYEAILLKNAESDIEMQPGDWKSYLPESAIKGPLTSWSLFSSGVKWGDAILNHFSNKKQKSGTPSAKQFLDQAIGEDPMNDMAWTALFNTMLIGVRKQTPEQRCYITKLKRFGVRSFGVKEQGLGNYDEVVRATIATLKDKDYFNLAQIAEDYVGKDHYMSGRSAYSVLSLSAWQSKAIKDPEEKAIEQVIMLGWELSSLKNPRMSLQQQMARLHKAALEQFKKEVEELKRIAK